MQILLAHTIQNTYELLNPSSFPSFFYNLRLIKHLTRMSEKIFFHLSYFCSQDQTDAEVNSTALRVIDQFTPKDD